MATPLPCVPYCIRETLCLFLSFTSFLLECHRRFAINLLTSLYGQTNPTRILTVCYLPTVHLAVLPSSSVLCSL